MTLIRDVMSKTVAAVAPDLRIVDAAKKMAQMRVGSLVVVDDRGICGIITEKDMFKKIIAEELGYQDLHVKDIMASPVVTITPLTSLTEASRKMGAGGFRRLPVVEGGKLVGIVTETDLWLKLTEEAVDNIKKDVGGSIPSMLEEYFNKLTGLNEQLKAEMGRLRESEEKAKQQHEALLAINETIANRQKTLLESEQNLKNILNSVKEGITLSDESGRFEVFNTEMENLTGYSKTEADSTADFSSLIYPDPKEKFENLKILGEMREGERHEAETVIRSKDGGTRGVIVSTTVISYNGRRMYLSAYHDITERKKAEETLRFLSSVVEQSYDGMAVADLEGNLLFANQAWAQMHGYESKDNLIGQHLSVFHSQEQLKKDVVPFNQGVMGKGANVGEVGHIKKDGTPFPTLMTTTLLKNEAGKPIAIAGIAHDITERKRAEDALRKSEVRLKTLVENIPQKIFLKDRNSVYISCNENYARDLKIKQEEIAGKTDYDFYPKDLAEKYGVDDQRVMGAGKLEDIEEEYVQDGKRFWVHTIKVPVRDASGKVTSLLGIFWDITKSKQNEAELKRRLTQEQVVERISSNFVHVDDLDHALNYALGEMGAGINVSRTYLFRFHDEAKFMSNTHEWVAKGITPQKDNLQNIPSETLTWWVNKLQRREIINYRSIGDIPDETTRNMLKQQDIKAILALPIYIGKKMYGFLGLDECTSEREWHEEDVGLINTVAELISMGVQRSLDHERLKNAKEDLEKKVYERTKELTKAYDELREADKVKDDFLAITSHELKTPLTSILGLTQLIQAELADKMTQDEKEDVKIVLDEANRLKKLIDELLELARLDAGKQVFNMAELDLKKLADETAEELESYSAQFNVPIKVEAFDEPTVKGDYDSIKRLLINLVNNAIKYSSGRPGEVTVGARREGDTVVAYVRDKGIGIPDEAKGKVFTRFYQVDSSKSRKYGGTGLGLAICKKIAEAHGEKIWFESKLGEGSTFYFTLPIFNKGK